MESFLCLQTSEQFRWFSNLGTINFFFSKYDFGAALGRIRACRAGLFKGHPLTSAQGAVEVICLD